MSLYKTVPVPDRGVDYQVQPHAIDPRAWTKLDTFRTRVGTIRSFEGWTTILVPPLPGPILGIVEYLKSISMERFILIATSTEFYKYDAILQVASKLSVRINVRAPEAAVEFRVPAFTGVVAPTVVTEFRIPPIGVNFTLIEPQVTVLNIFANPPVSPP